MMEVEDVSNLNVLLTITTFCWCNVAMETIYNLNVLLTKNISWCNFDIRECLEYKYFVNNKTFRWCILTK